MYCAGILDQHQLDDLTARGWEPEPMPIEMIPERFTEQRGALRFDPLTSEFYARFFVDSDLFDVMTGPDWEPGPSTPPARHSPPL